MRTTKSKLASDGPCRRGQLAQSLPKPQGHPANSGKPVSLRLSLWALRRFGSFVQRAEVALLAMSRCAPFQKCSHQRVHPRTLNSHITPKLSRLQDGPRWIPPIRGQYCYRGPKKVLEVENWGFEFRVWGLRANKALKAQTLTLSPTKPQTQSPKP